MSDSTAARIDRRMDELQKQITEAQETLTTVVGVLLHAQLTATQIGIDVVHERMSRRGEDA